MHRQGTESRGEGDMEADRDTWIGLCRHLQCVRFVAADGRTHHHHGSGIETATFDQVAYRAVDAGADAVVVGAQPDAPRHSAAVLSLVSPVTRASARLSECSATKEIGRAFSSGRTLPIYFPP